MEDAFAIMEERLRCRRASDREESNDDVLVGETPQSEQAMLIIDFSGYSLFVDSDPRTAIRAAPLLAHFPERLGSAVLLDAPRVFAGTWSLLCHLIDAATAAKFKFVSSTDGSLQAELTTWAGSPLDAWLLAEIDDNRTSPRFEKEYWTAPLDLLGHDPRGVPDYVASPEYAKTFAGAARTRTRTAAVPSSEPEPEQENTGLVASWFSKC